MCKKFSTGALLRSEAAECGEACGFQFGDAKMVVRLWRSYTEKSVWNFSALKGEFHAHSIHISSSGNKHRA
jgi:hypothetical protein